MTQFCQVNFDLLIQDHSHSKWTKFDKVPLITPKILHLKEWDLRIESGDGCHQHRHIN